jgi:hypothetical protein
MGGLNARLYLSGQNMFIATKRILRHMKETKLKRLIKKMMDSIFLDAMTPEFKAANAELLKAIKMNDKSGAVPHADLEAVNKAMKENDADKAGAALKKVQLQLSKSEKALDEEVKDINARLADAKQAGEKAKQELKAKKVLASVFEKLKALVSGLSNNPKSASKLTALTDKVKDYGDLSKRASQIITLVSSNKDASKQIDMLKKSVDAAEKKYKKDLANAEKESKKADDALEVAKMQVKITQGKKDAFTKERLYIANVVKQMPQGDLRQEREQKEEQKQELPPREISSVLLKKIIKARSAYKQAVEEMNKAISAYENSDAAKFVNESKHVEKLSSLFAAAENALSNSKDAKTNLIYNWLKNIAASFRAKGDIEKGSTDVLYDISKVSNDAKKAVKPIIDYYNKYKGMKEHLAKSSFNGLEPHTVQTIKEYLNKGDIERAVSVMAMWMYEPKKSKTALEAINNAWSAVNTYRRKLNLPSLSENEFRKAISGNDYIQKILY